MANYDDIMGGNETQRPETAATMDADELLGETLDGRYQIQKKLGPRKVVVKVMRLEEANKQWNRARFKQEVEALSRIDHPGIVRVFDCGETTSGRPYIVMQYIDGNNLRSLLTL